jgi:hypothetical protein
LPVDADEVSEIRSRCEKDHPGIWNYFDQRECIENARRESREAEEQRQRQQREAEAKRTREERARPCIAEDVKRMEGLAWKARGALREDMNLAQAQTALEPILGKKGGIVVAGDNIKQKVLAYYIETQCDSAFGLLTNVRANDYGQLRWFRVWAQESPKGYPSGSDDALTRDFDGERWQKLKREIQERERKETASKLKLRAPSQDRDHCAPNLSPEERLRRLANYGAVREVSDQNYVAGDHGVWFGSSYSRTLYRCY